MSEIKFCKDCKHFELINKGFETCGAPQQPMETSGSYLVSGEESRKVRRWPYCSVQRESESPLACGREALWFEPREPIKAESKTDDDQFLGDELRRPKGIDIDRYADDPRHDQCRGGKFSE